MRRKAFLLTLLLTLLLRCHWFTPCASAEGQKVDLVGLTGSLSTGTITCGVGATAVPTTALSGRRGILITNISGTDIFVGNSVVTTSIGFRVADGAAVTLDAADAITVYCISAAGDKEVRYLEIR